MELLTPRPRDLDRPVKACMERPGIVIDMVLETASSVIGEIGMSSSSSEFPWYSEMDSVMLFVLIRLNIGFRPIVSWTGTSREGPALTGSGI